MMKKTVGIGLAVCIILSLCSCQKTPNTIVNEAPKEDISFISVMLGEKTLRNGMRTMLLQMYHGTN